MVGQTLGYYRIESRLGAGGMGVVYRAHDTRLERTVALKLLGEQFRADEMARARLLNEARTASALNHPHICTIYEVGEAEGQAYIAMEYVEGQTLSVLAPGEGLPLEMVVRYGAQIADALAHAHERGVVHRDLKGSNVVITPEGRAKVLDFGLARRLRQEELAEATRSRLSLAEAGAVAGTLHYMAPEVLRGQSADARSDLWALGVLLYETAAGVLPFRGQTAFELTSAILRETPAPPRAPAGLRAIIERCLAKEPGLRYQRAGEVRAALEAIHSDAALLPAARLDRTGRPPALPRLLSLTVAGVLTLLLLLVSLYVFALLDRGKAIDSVAVLPFVNAGADPNTEYLSDGLTESIINTLSQLPHLRVTARSTAFRYKDREMDPQKVGRDLHVRAVLTGRVIQRGDTLIIQADLVDVEKGSQLWGERYNRKLADIVALQEEIARQISEKLRLRLSGEEQQRLARRHTENSEAYQLYLKGRYYWNKRTEEGFKRGIEYFGQAIDRDRNYALAYAGLADCYNLLGPYEALPPREASPKALAAATKALEIDDKLAEPHTSLAWVRYAFDWDWSAAEKEFKRAIELNPRYPTAHHWYAFYLSSVGRSDEAMAEIRRAQELDPLSLVINSNIGLFLYYARRYDRAIEEFQKTLEMDPNFLPAHWQLGQTYEQKGMYREAITEFQKAIALSAGSPMYVAQLGRVHAVSGNKVEAHKALQKLNDLGKRRYLSSYYIALIYAGLGEAEQAFTWLERAYEERSFYVVDLNVDPRLDSLRSDSRFQDLVRRVGLPKT